MKYLIVYSDEKFDLPNYQRELFHTIHIDNVNHANLIGRTYFDVFLTIDCFPTEEQLIELQCCLKRK